MQHPHRIHRTRRPPHCSHRSHHCCSAPYRRIPPLADHIPASGTRGRVSHRRAACRTLRPRQPDRGAARCAGGGENDGAEQAERMAAACHRHHYHHSRAMLSAHRRSCRRHERLPRHKLRHTPPTPYPSPPPPRCRHHHLHHRSQLYGQLKSRAPSLPPWMRARPAHPSSV